MCTDGESPSFYKVSFPPARKKHICCECSSDIDPGEKYESFTGIWDEGWDTYKTCETCQMIRIEAKSMIDEDIPFECLYEITGSEFEYAAT
jgi:RNase P subunit RPR2